MPNQPWLHLMPSGHGDPMQHSSPGAAHRSPQQVRFFEQAPPPQHCCEATEAHTVPHHICPGGQRSVSAAVTARLARRATRRIQAT